MAHVAVDTNFPDSDAAVELGRRLSLRLAWCHVVRLWAWGIDQDLQDGVLHIDAERMAEVSSFRGDAKLYLDSLVAVGLLVPRGDDSYYMSGWSRNAEYFQKKNRMRKYRQRKRAEMSDASNQAATADDTSSVTSQVTSPEASPEASRVPRSPSPSPSPSHRIDHDPSPELKAGIEQVAEHYAKVHPTLHRQAKSKKNISRIRARLEDDKYTPQQLCDAIDSNAKDPWHAERFKHELEYVVRNAEHVDRFLAMKGGPTSLAVVGGGASSFGQSNLTRKGQELQKALTVAMASRGSMFDDVLHPERLAK